MTQTIQELRSKIKGMRRPNRPGGPMSYEAIARLLHVSKGIVFAIHAHNHDPDDPRIRSALGLGQKVCEHCKRKLAPPRKAIPRTAMTPAQAWWRNELTSDQRKHYIQIMHDFEFQNDPKMPTIKRRTDHDHR